MGTFVDLEDFEPFATIEASKLEKMIEDAEAMASLPAPCLLEADFVADAQRVAQVRAVLRGAILRWDEAGSGASSHVVAGPFGQTLDTRQPRKGMFYPSEIEQLRDICKSYTQAGEKKAFAVDTAPTTLTGVHAVDCNLVFGGLYCSCGSDLNNLEGPLWGGITP